MAVDKSQTHAEKIRSKKSEGLKELIKTVRNWEMYLVGFSMENVLKERAMQIEAGRRWKQESIGEVAFEWTRRSEVVSSSESSRKYYNSK